MGHLLKLELRKFQTAKNVSFALAAVVCIIFSVTVSLADSMTDPQQTKDTFESTFLVIQLLISYLFVIYASVLISGLILQEYQQGTIAVLFSCPVSRTKLIASKLVLIMSFTAISMLVGFVCCCGYLVAVDAAFDMLEGTFQLSLLHTWIPTAATSILVCTVLSLWPFIVGMIFRSVPVTIVSSLVVLVVRQLIITNNAANQESLPQALLTIAVTFAFTLLIFIKQVTKV